MFKEMLERELDKPVSTVLATAPETGVIYKFGRQTIHARTESIESDLTIESTEDVNDVLKFIWVARDSDRFNEIAFKDEINQATHSGWLTNESFRYLTEDDIRNSYFRPCDAAVEFYKKNPKYHDTMQFIYYAPVQEISLDNRVQLTLWHMEGFETFSTGFMDNIISMFLKQDDAVFEATLQGLSEENIIKLLDPELHGFKYSERLPSIAKRVNFKDGIVCRKAWEHLLDREFSNDIPITLSRIGGGRKEVMHDWLELLTWAALRIGNRQEYIDTLMKHLWADGKQHLRNPHQALQIQMSIAKDYGIDIADLAFLLPEGTLKTVNESMGWDGDIPLEWALKVYTPKLEDAYPSFLDYGS